MASSSGKARRISLTDIDDLGHLRREIAVLKEKEKLLSDEIKKGLEGGQTVYGNSFKATLVSTTTRDIDPIELSQRLPVEKFARCVKVVLEKLKKVMPLDEIDEISEVSEGSPRLMVEPFEGGVDAEVSVSVEVPAKAQAAKKIKVGR